MKVWLLRDPVLHGQFLGGLYLAATRFVTGLWIISGGLQVELWGCLYSAAWALPGFFWGWIMGGEAGKAYRAFLDGERSKARKICRDCGYNTLVILAIWMVLLWIGFGYTDHWQALLVGAVVYPVITVTPLASLLMITVSYFLPKDSDRPIQITEELTL